MKKNKLDITTNISKTNERLINAATMDKEKLLLAYETSMCGYNDAMVEIMSSRYGSNHITQQKNDSLYKQLIAAFINPFTLVLFMLALISVITDVVVVAPDDHDFTSVTIVMTMVIISGTLRFIQETRSNKSAEKLSAMVKTTTAVQRANYGKIEISLSNVVVGDIIHLAAGDMLPADVRVLQAKDLFISQSSLTGESASLEKFGEKSSKQYTSPLEFNNLAFMGTNVISGSAICIVIAIGDDTLFGAIAQAVSGKKIVTNFEKGVNSVSWLLIRFMMCMAPVVLFINGFTKGDWLEAVLFSLSVAVGLTPEMLPMIVTTNLAKGAVTMAKKKTIIKNLNSIQNFGAMDILCTDKTGTLTQDKVVLEYHLNIHGKEDTRVLRHAFLNSFHQTGLKNLMDVAILKHSKEKEMLGLIEKYHKIDEIPFDFNRRRMSVVVADENGKTQIITKGAVEEMLAISAYAEYQGNIEPLTDSIREKVLKTVGELNAGGMRVIAIAQKNTSLATGIFSVTAESEMVLMGYLAFLDPPKETAKTAIKVLQEYGVSVKVLTGDNDAVTRSICRQVGIKVDCLLLGSDIEEMNDEMLRLAVEKSNVFAKLSPQQKARIVYALKKNDHTVGFMGDGINDAAAMTVADVGISVDTAVDIAKESADIILLEKDLMILEQGVIEGRKIFGNIIKYIKMTASSNFGNMFSVVLASAFLPFLPMLPIQILVLNLIYDISCISIPWDNIDDEYLKTPKKWDASSIGKFMFWIGPTSSVFDLTTYAILFFIICPAVCGGNYGASNVDNILFMKIFNTGWFVESLWSQTLVIHMIRTAKIPFIQSRASFPVLSITTTSIVIGTIIPYTILGENIGMSPLPLTYFPWLIGIIMTYMLSVTVMKKMYIKKYGELL